MALTPQERQLVEMWTAKGGDPQTALLKIKERREAKGIPSPPPGGDVVPAAPSARGGGPQRPGKFALQPGLATVIRGGRAVPVVEEEALDPRVRGLIQNFTSGNSEEVANWLRSQGKTVERDSLDRLVISTPGDPRPRVIDPARFEIGDITDLLADVGVGTLTGFGSSLARRAGTLAATKLGPPVVRAGARLLSGELGLAAGGGAGAAAGETLRQAIGSPIEPIDPKSIAVAGGVAGAAPIVTGTASRFLGRLGSVPQETITETMTSPMIGRGAAIGRVLPPMEKEAEHLLGRKLDASIKASRAMSKARPEFKPMLQQALNQDVKIDGKRIVDRVLANVDESAVGARKAANKKLEELADDLISQLEPGDVIDPMKLDHILRKDLRAPISDLLGREGGDAYKKALKDIQAFVARELQDTIDRAGIRSPSGLTAREVQAAESAKIASRKRVAGEFTRRIKGTPEEVATSTRIRSVFEPGNEAKKEALEAYDKLHGTDLTRQARELATKRDWNPDERERARGLDRVIRGLLFWSRPSAKAATVLTRPVQAVIGGGAGRRVKKREKPEELPSP